MFLWCDIRFIGGFITNRYSIEKAQSILDIRNGNFKIIKYNGMREHSIVQCLRCNHYLDVSIDSLLRKQGDGFGCVYCNENEANDKLKENSLIFLKNLGSGIVYVTCDICNNTFAIKRKLATAKNFLCKYCMPKNKTKRILENPTRFGKRTVYVASVDNNIRKLLYSKPIELFYFLGIMMSDGTFNYPKGRMRLRLNKEDEQTVKYISELIGCKMIYSNKIVGIDISCASVREVMDMYKIDDKKTYHPCDISSLHGTNMLAFAIGFIDGDGHICVKNDKRTSVVIKVHASWKDNLSFMADEIYKYFGCDRVPKAHIVKYNNKEYAQIIMSNKNVILGIKEFALDKKLITMPRKWDIIGGG